MSGSTNCGTSAWQNTIQQWKDELWGSLAAKNLALSLLWYRFGGRAKKKKKKLSDHRKIWRNLKCMLSERRRSEKATHFMLLTTWNSVKGKTVMTVRGTMVAKGLEVQGWVGRQDTGFLGQWIYSAWLCMVYTYHCTLIKAIEMYKTMSEI